MAKSFSIVTILMVMYIGWIFLASDSQVRIERVCHPVVWGGNVAVSVTSLTFNDSQDSVQEAFNNLDYGCRFTVWRLFYEKEYLEALEKQKLLEEQGLQPVQPGGEAKTPNGSGMVIVK